MYEEDGRTQIACNKFRKTNLEKFGHKNAMQNEDVLTKYSNSIKEKYIN